ncbi:centrosomal protein of 83 kDa isoform X1 [Poecilia formosa]|uniref:centrosomal protein of 83 kDa isoform X1 n=1 Tax=Poecilia formosa TaxID=48698 RepID=UPI000443D9F9|nr:PREDICTED: centrosomal protein of 83 kDa isoform X1 [Poecilia formosa]XP_007573124.1 PREDICTED: centrosomal protein of 83 kDa isoform X1 [Poecilia formosa]
MASLGQPASMVANLVPGMGKSAAVLGLSAGLGGAELELQKMLIDERIKSENHRTNYQTLKAEHTSLQTQFTHAQGEVRRLLSEKQSEQERLQLLLAELRGELLGKTRELEELRLQVVTPQRLELLRAQVQQEMEAPVRERFNKLEEEAEKYRSEYNKLRYDFTVVKSQLEHQREEHSRILEERRVLHEAEVARLEKEREELVAQYQDSEALCDGKRVEALLREKAQLRQRLKGLEAEVAELRAQRDTSGQQAESVQRIQIRQLTELQSVVKSQEAERQSLRQQLDRMESELQQSHEQNGQLTGRLHRAEREASALTAQIDSLKHSHKLELASVRLECVRSKGDMERERDTLQGQMDGLQADVEVLKAALERNKEVLLEKEREMVRKVQSAREEEFHKMATLHEERLELENRLAVLEQQRALQDSSDQALKEEWEERLRSAQQGEESLRRELQNLRNKVQQQSSQLEELERQKTEISDLQQQNQELSVQLGALSRSEGELTDANQRLRETLDRVREEVRATRAQAERSQHEAERMVEDRRVEWLEEKHRLQEREAELQQKYSQAKEKLQRAAVAQKKRKHQTENREKKLHNKIQLLEAKIEQLELEAAAAIKRWMSLHHVCSSSVTHHLLIILIFYSSRRSVFSEEQAQLKRRLKELQRRHDEFRSLLLSGQGPALMTSRLSLGVEGRLAADLEGEFSLLQRRLESLENAQQQQLEELGSLVQKEHDEPPKHDPLTSDPVTLDL